MFGISEYRQDLNRTHYVCAPPGYCRAAGGSGIYRDGTDLRHSGPEWSENRSHAHGFKSHRAAARVRNKCGPGAEIFKLD
jgi:hypothetical protein